MDKMTKVFNGLNSNVSKSRNILLTAYYKILYFICIYALGKVLDKPRFGVRMWLRGTGPHGRWQAANRAELPTPCKGQHSAAILAVTDGQLWFSVLQFSLSKNHHSIYIERKYVIFTKLRKEKPLCVHVCTRTQNMELGILVSSPRAV